MHRDAGIKNRLHEAHGVRECCTVDPEPQAAEAPCTIHDGFVQHARAVDSGTVSFVLLDGVAFRPDDLL
jgi:hypothetical protein